MFADEPPMQSTPGPVLVNEPPPTLSLIAAVEIDGVAADDDRTRPAGQIDAVLEGQANCRPSRRSAAADRRSSCRRRPNRSPKPAWSASPAPPTLTESGLAPAEKPPPPSPHWNVAAAGAEAAGEARGVEDLQHAAVEVDEAVRRNARGAADPRLQDAAVDGRGAAVGVGARRASARPPPVLMMPAEPEMLPVISAMSLSVFGLSST